MRWSPLLLLLLLRGARAAGGVYLPPPPDGESDADLSENVNYLPAEVVVPQWAPPPDAVAVDVRFDVVMPKASAKIVWCKSFLLDAADGVDPTNIVAVEPMAGNQTIHHMHMHLCDADSPKWLEHQNMYKYDEGDVPRTCRIHQGDAGCHGIGWSFLPGQGGMTFPKGVGLKIGNGRWDFRHVLLEVQYDDEYTTEGLISQPGFRFWAKKDNVVKHHAGMMMIDNLFLPPLPKSPRLALTLHCTSACTQRFSWDMHVFATYGHTQIEGMKIHSQIEGLNSSIWRKLAQTGHIDEEWVRRDPTITHDVLRNTSFTEFTIKRGDRLSTTCEYNIWADSVDHPLGKWTMNNGICAQTFVYWPKQDTSSCGYVSAGEEVCGDTAPARRR
jgi:hypothetical protein